MNESLLRELVPAVIGVLVRRGADFAAAEDAVQEALVEAVRGRPDDAPRDPKGWLVTVAWRKFLDAVRADTSRRRREELVEAEPTPDPGRAVDDTLQLYFLCAHPALTPASAVALTLRAVGGLTTRQIAQAYLVPESTMAQRISRAKQRIRESGAEFRMPPPDDVPDRLREVLHVLYLVFTEGHTASTGDELHRVDLTAEAIRLTRQAHALLPDDGEVAGLLALMLLTEARRPARTNEAGELVPLAEQDRSRWDTAYVHEGIALVTDSLTRTRLGPYQVQAAIAAVHDEAPSGAETDWEQVLALYGLLEQLAPGPVVTLNRAVALAMVEGPAAGLAVLDDLEQDKRLARHHRLHAVRAHLLEMSGDTERARESYLLASRLTTSIPEQDHLRRKAEAL